MGADTEAELQFKMLNFKMVWENVQLHFEQGALETDNQHWPDEWVER